MSRHLNLTSSSTDKDIELIEEVKQYLLDNKSYKNYTPKMLTYGALVGCEAAKYCGVLLSDMSIY